MRTRPGLDLLTAQHTRLWTTIRALSSFSQGLSVQRHDARPSQPSTIAAPFSDKKPSRLIRQAVSGASASGTWLLCREVEVLYRSEVSGRVFLSGLRPRPRSQQPMPVLALRTVKDTSRAARPAEPGRDPGIEGNHWSDVASALDSRATTTASRHARAGSRRPRRPRDAAGGGSLV